MLERSLENDGRSTVPGRVDTIQGVKSLTALYGVPRFKYTFGEVTDLLHAAYEGLGKLILQLMVSTKSKSYSFQKLNGADLEYFDKIVKDSTFFHELSRVCPTLKTVSYWKAFDFFVFFVFFTGPVCADPEEIGEDYYEMIREFTNSIVWLTYSYPCERSILRAKLAVERFSELFLKNFGTARATHKFHTFQHLPVLVKYHGSATQFDSFQGEGMLGFIKESITTTKATMFHICRHLVLRYHGICFKNFKDMHPDAQKLLSKFHGGTDGEEPLKKFRKKELSAVKKKLAKVTTTRHIICWRTSNC